MSARRRAALLALVLAAPAAPAAAQESARSAVGTNLSQLTDWSGEWPFVDHWKTSRWWIEGERFGCWQCGPPLDLDAQGWVRSLDGTRPNGGQVARTLLFTYPEGAAAPPGFYPGGTYHLLYDGEGQLEYGGAAARDGGASTPGHDVVQVTPNGGPVVITLVQTNPLDYLRNVRILPPGGACANDAARACATAADCRRGASCRLFVDHHASQRFSPVFLDRLRGYRVVRVMNWMAANDSPAVEIGDYAALDDARWPAAPAEVLAELANELHADLWITIPHQASDAFVTAFATMLRARLERTRKVWVEYSNEVWNSQFAQHGWTAVQGCTLYADIQAGCDADAAPGNGVYCEGYPWPSWVESCRSGQIRFHSRRSREVWALFTSAFGDAARVVRVLGSQVGQTWLHGQYLAWENTWQQTDVLATAPYLGIGYGADPAVAGWTVDQLMTSLEQQELPAVLGWIDADASFLAANYPGVRLVAYEGGQHLVGLGAHLNDPQMNALFDAANRDPRMGDLLAALLAGWRQRGGTLFAHYLSVGVWSRFGRWGLLEFQDQDPALSPKWQGLHGFIAGNPCWWSGCVDPYVFADGFESGADWSWSAQTPGS
jgi:hypothetical protein